MGPCRWCGEPDTDWHRYWACRHIASLPDEQSEIRKSANLAPILLEEVAELSCFWSRGLLPFSLTAASLYGPVRSIALSGGDVRDRGEEGGGPALACGALPARGPGQGAARRRRAGAPRLRAGPPRKRAENESTVKTLAGRILW